MWVSDWVTHSEGVKWIMLAKDGVHELGFVNTVLNIWVL